MYEHTRLSVILKHDQQHNMITTDYHQAYAIPSLILLQLIDKQKRSSIRLKTTVGKTIRDADYEQVWGIAEPSDVFMGLICGLVPHDSRNEAFER